ncbi:MAG: SRPBCC domain-containing protein [Acidobacteriota bacterium]|nr:SRPBCC domain-containing protein [Acidobacteriota bacterium]
MATRKHIHQIELAASPEKVFRLLITPSAIRGWWGASRAIVMAKEDGVWAAAWGDEDIPDYVTVYKIAAIEPPRQLFLTDTKYFAKTGQPPFDAKMTTEFTIEANGEGSILRVTQDGFPADAVADDFYAACEDGWRATFASIERYLSQNG